MARRRAILSLVLAGASVSLLICSDRVAATGSVRTPQQVLGFKVGADNRLARWDSIVDYMKLAAAGSERVRYREIGKTSGGNPFIVLEISAPDTLTSLDRYKQMERKLYFQDGAPPEGERDAIFRQGKLVLLVTCSIHATEIGASQMSLELVHRLATDDSPAVKKILDNVIVLLVPSLNPDGQVMVTDWFNKNLGTPYEGSPLPYLYHRYAGHDNNRDMYMFTQKESQYTAQLLWHDWFPAVWLDEHQMGSDAARIFVMPAADPINPNVHPLIYRWNAILGQSQAAALEAAGKEGIIYNSIYTNFWEGAMAWSGWWHNQIGLLTEVASARVAAPIDQQSAVPVRPWAAGGGGSRRAGEGSSAPIPPPTDINPRTNYPRPWLGGHWTLRDIVDYELIATMALLETAADRREAIMRQIYEVNRLTIENGRKASPSAILVPVEGQHDAREAVHLVDRLRLGGVDVYRADTSFEADGRKYGAGTFVIPMAQVFARYAKDLLERQTYPEVRRGPNWSPEPPFDVTAWSLGMQLGVTTTFVNNPLPDMLKMTRITSLPKLPGGVTGLGSSFLFAYNGADTAIAINRLLKDGAHVSFGLPQSADAGIPRAVEAPAARASSESSSSAARASDSLEPSAPRRGPGAGPRRRDEGGAPQAMEAPAARASSESSSSAARASGGGAPRAVIKVSGVAKSRMQAIATEFSLSARALDEGAAPNPQFIAFHAPRIAMYQPWTGGNMDEGWTRWVLEQYEFGSSPIHNAEIRAGALRQKFDAIILADQSPREIVDGNLKQFVADGGTLIVMGSACDLAIDRLAIPVRNGKGGLSRDQHFAPGAILRIQVDTTDPLGYGMAPDTYGFYVNSPFFSLPEGPATGRTKVVASYPSTDLLASGLLNGEELMAGRAAVVAVDMAPGRVVLFGLRPQHRAQTHATFPMLFNALYLSAAKAIP
jgi:hypothetical protein